MGFEISRCGGVRPEVESLRALLEVRKRTAPPEVKLCYTRAAAVVAQGLSKTSQTLSHTHIWLAVLQLRLPSYLIVLYRLLARRSPQQHVGVWDAGRGAHELQELQEHVRRSRIHYVP